MNIVLDWSKINNVKSFEAKDALYTNATPNQLYL